MNRPVDAPVPARGPGQDTDPVRTVLPPGRVGPAWLVGPRSHFVDRVEPDCEEIRLAPAAFGGGALSFAPGRLRAVPEPSGRVETLRRRLLPRRRRIEAADLLVNLRVHNPENWAHFLTNHLPIVFALARGLDLDPARLTALLPNRTPGHVLGAAALFGLKTLRSDDLVEGPGLLFEAAPWTGIRAARIDWARDPWPRGALDRAGVRGAGDRPVPRRVFVARRDTRRVANTDEISALLARRGFETLFAEDLSVLDQFRLFEQAEEIVAVHGAALAPLLYRSPEAAPGRVMELFPAGHVTNAWRVVADQVGCRWIGVRGRLRPEHLADGYDLSRPFTRYSIQDFEVDPVSIDRAFDLLDDPPPARKTAP